jgi:hypothetical protein
MARGSLNELEVLLWVSEATGIVSTDSRKVVQEKLDRLFAMTSGLIHRADRKRPVHR